MTPYQKIQELLNEGTRPIEERRVNPYNWFDCAYEGLERPPTATGDPAATKPSRPTVTGKPKKGLSNPLRAGDQSTII